MVLQGFIIQLLTGLMVFFACLFSYTGFHKVKGGRLSWFEFHFFWVWGL